MGSCRSRISHPAQIKSVQKRVVNNVRTTAVDWQRKASHLTHRKTWNKSQSTCGEAFQSIAVVLAGWVWYISIMGTDWPCFLAACASLHCFDGHFYWDILHAFGEFISKRKEYKTVESQIYYTESKYREGNVRRRRRRKKHTLSRQKQVMTFQQVPAQMVVQEPSVILITCH